MSACLNKLPALIQHLFDYPTVSDRIAAREVGVARQTAARYRALLAASSRPRADFEPMDGEEIFNALNHTPRGAPKKIRPDMAQVRARIWDEVRRRKKSGFTLLGVYEEFVETLTSEGKQPEEGIGYAQLARLYSQHEVDAQLEAINVHQPAYAVQVDFSGAKPFYRHPETKQRIQAELFVAVLPYSSYTFATCVASQNVENWLLALDRMAMFLGGMPQVIVSDNLKSAVNKAGRVPEIAKHHLGWARHHGVAAHAVMPRCPTHKGAVENGVKVAQAALLMKLDRKEFLSLEELNEEVRKLIDARNARPFTDKFRNGSRKSEFEADEKPKLRALPSTRYVYGDWSPPKIVPPNYHIAVGGHRYSVPHELVGKKVVPRLTPSAMEVWLHGKKVTEHLRPAAGLPTRTLTQPEHQPESHRIVQTRSNMANVIAWSLTVGPNTTAFIAAVFEDKRVPLQRLPDALEVWRLASGRPIEAIEAACQRAGGFRQYTAAGFHRALEFLNPAAPTPPPPPTPRIRSHLAPSIRRPKGATQ